MMKKAYLFFLAIILFTSTNAQTIDSNKKISLNPFITIFLKNLVTKEVNLEKSYLTVISLKDEDGNYNVDFALTPGNLRTLQITSPREAKMKYGNILILLDGKTPKDLIFLKKYIEKSNDVFVNKNKIINNHSFYDEDYVWSTFIDVKKGLINFYIPEEKDTAEQLFDSIKYKIKISPNFKNVDCNCF